MIDELIEQLTIIFRTHTLTRNNIENLSKLIGYLKELKTLRVKFKRNSKELEVYKRALEMACETIFYDAPRVNDVNFYVNQYLDKARKENNENT